MITNELKILYPVYLAYIAMTTVICLSFEHFFIVEYTITKTIQNNVL